MARYGARVLYMDRKKLLNHYINLLSKACNNEEEHAKDILCNENKTIRHALWMSKEALKTCDIGIPEKTDRWIGFIQGIFWMEKVFSIDSLRNHSMGNYDSIIELESNMGNKK